MDTKVYVDKLFAGYEDTNELRDFKLEIAANLDDRVADLKKKGASDAEAFSKAVSELGDITEVADEISKQKRNEVLNNMYVHQKIKISAPRALGYVLSGGLMLFGVVISVWTFFNDSGVASAVPFVSPAVAALVFLGLTQETRTNFPMSHKRALWYALAALVGTFGIAMSAFLFVRDAYYDNNIMSSIGAMLVFIIPSALLLAFLVLTEKKRHKPWVMEQYQSQYAEAFSGKNAERFGMRTAILWTLSIALFVTLGVFFGFQYSWLVFLFSIVGELWLTYDMMNKK